MYVSVLDAVHVESASSGLGERGSIMPQVQLLNQVKTKQWLQDALDNTVLLPVLWSSPVETIDLKKMKMKMKMEHFYISLQ